MKCLIEPLSTKVKMWTYMSIPRIMLSDWLSAEAVGMDDILDPEYVVKSR